MAQATITARVDENDKKLFDEFCSDVGLNTSTAVNMFVKAVLRERRLPFEVTQSPDPFYFDTNQRHILQSIQQIRDGKVVVKSIEELEAMENE